MYEIIPPFINSFINPDLFPSFTCRTEYFKSSFSPSVINDWNKFYSKTRNSASYLNFINPLINFVRPLENKIFNIHDQVGVKLLTRLRLSFSRLTEHEFRHNFANTLNPQFLVLSSVTQQCIFFCASISIMLFGKNLSYLLNIDSSLPTENDEKLLHILLYGNSKFNTITNQNILIYTLKFIKDSHRFGNPLF